MNFHLSVTTSTFSFNHVVFQDRKRQGILYILLREVRYKTYTQSDKSHVKKSQREREREGTQSGKKCGQYFTGIRWKVSI